MQDIEGAYSSPRRHQEQEEDTAQVSERGVVPVQSNNNNHNDNDERSPSPSMTSRRPPMSNHNDNLNDDDDMTEINIDEGDHISGSNFVSRLERMHDRNNGNTSRFFWSEEEERVYQDQRRERLSEELLRIQRKNFVHFTILCMVPLLLLLLVVISSLSSKETCDGYEIASCEFEERSFMNAFARRCICTAFTMSN